MKNWLIKRLTPRKKQEERWTGLADGLQQVWEESFDPALARLENLRSYFLADDTDLALKLREMGDYFATDMPRLQDRPIAVAWRRLELEYKDIELILTSVFRRHYSDLPVTWFPIFAPIHEAYGLSFTTAEGPWPERKNIPPKGMFLTSRGRLGADYSHLLRMGLTKEAFLAKGVPLLMRTKPLHIVYDGPLWYIRFDLPFESELSITWARDAYIELPFAVIGSRFDITPADVRALDIHSVTCRRESDRFIAFPFTGEPDALDWHTDWHAPEGLSVGWLPLDFVLPGVEGQPIGPFALYHVDTRQPFQLPVKRLTVSLHKDVQPLHSPFSISTVSHVESSVTTSFPAFVATPDWLDRFPCFDEIPADSFPLDMPVGGFYA